MGHAGALLGNEDNVVSLGRALERVSLASTLAVEGTAKLLSTILLPKRLIKILHYELTELLTRLLERIDRKRTYS